MLLLCVLCLGGGAAVQAKSAKGGKWEETDEGTKYCYKDGTYAQAVWQKIGSNYYYFNEHQLLVKNKMFKVGGKYYCTDKNGARITSQWVTKKKKTYYFNKSGVRLQKRWLKQKKKYYYFKSNGVLAVNCWVGKYYVGADGARVKDCIVDGYYVDKTGKRKMRAYKYIFVGDSRTVGMEMAVSTKDAMFIGKVSMGYDWLKSTASVTLQNYLKSMPKVKVIWAFGVNDMDNVSKYISYYKKLQKQYPDTEFYMMSVNPVDEARASAYGYSTSYVNNTRIKAFNKKLKKEFGSSYLDLYTYLSKGNRLATADGIHYSSNTYNIIYNRVVGLVDSQE